MLILDYRQFRRKLHINLPSGLKKEYELKIQVDKIIPSILGGLHCNDFLILDGNNDTLIYIEKFKLQTSNYSFKHFNKVYIQDIVLNFVIIKIQFQIQIYLKFLNLFWPLKVTPNQL